MLSIDIYAQRSNLAKINPTIKIIFALSALFTCVAGDTIYIGVATFLLALFLIVVLGKTKIAYVMRLMRLPTLFIIISCVTIAFNVSQVPAGICDIRILNTYLALTNQSLNQALILFFKAYGSIACLYFLSLTTPMQEIISTMHRCRIPNIIIELMYLIYRYIFLLLDVQNNMTVAATSRLGYTNYKSSFYTFSKIGANLLTFSFKRSRECFDAMEARCYDDKLEFFTSKIEIKAKDIVLFLSLYAILLLFYIK